MPSQTPTLEPTPTAEAEPTPEPAACVQIADAVDGWTGPAHGTLGYMPTPLLAKDLGPREGAQGEAVYDGDGYLGYYVVAEGDREDAITQRFCVNRYYLHNLNFIRRGELAYVEPPSDWHWPMAYSDGTGPVFDLYPGDIVNLHPATIATVGDQNGVVYENSGDIQIPPQR